MFWRWRGFFVGSWIWFFIIQLIGANHFFETDGKNQVSGLQKESLLNKFQYGCFRKKWVFPPNFPFGNRGFPLFSPSILGGKHPYFWKPPGGKEISRNKRCGTFCWNLRKVETCWLVEGCYCKMLQDLFLSSWFCYVHFVYILGSVLSWINQINSHTFSTFFFTELHFLCVASISLFRYPMKTGLMRLECQQIYNTHERSASQTDHPWIYWHLTSNL